MFFFYYSVFYGIFDNAPEFDSFCLISYNLMGVLGFLWCFSLHLCTATPHLRYFVIFIIFDISRYFDSLCCTYYESIVLWVFMGFLWCLSLLLCTASPHHGYSVYINNFQIYGVFMGLFWHFRYFKIFR